MTDPASQQASGDDDVKRKFKEALERKNADKHAGSSHADNDGKAHDAHGPAKAQRTFRRKSGG